MTHVQTDKPTGFLRPHQGGDRRRYNRFDQHGMVVRVGTTLLHVHDLSVGGIRVERIAADKGATVTLTMMPSTAGRIDLNRTHTVYGEVIGHVGAHTHIRFLSLSYTLAKFIIQHLARRTGVEPYIFR